MSLERYRGCMGEHVDDYTYLWTSEREEWVVLRADPDDLGLPYNRRSRGVLLIDEDEALAAAVVHRMAAEGLPVVEKVPD
jgi:hypothetical protein